MDLNKRVGSLSRKQLTELILNAPTETFLGKFK